MDFDTIKNRLQKVLSIIIEWCKTSYQKSLKEQALLQTAMQQQYLNKVQFDIQFELFCVMQGGNYPFLSPIHLPKNIRIHASQQIQNTFVFCYTIPVSAMPARTVLDRLKSQINMDIYQFQQNIIYDCGFDNAKFNHPYIISGLYVTDIQPFGTDILLKIVTNFYP